MKKSMLIILSIIVQQFTYGQNQTDIQQFADSVQTVKEIHFYEDTLWVMDSSHFYVSIDYNLQLAGTYNVLTRDGQGNKLTGLGMGDRVYGAFEYINLDSVFYFSGTNNIHHTKTYYWNGIASEWMDNIYELYDENQNRIEYYNKDWNLYENQYDEGKQIIRDYDNELLLCSTFNKYLPLYELWVHENKETISYNLSGKDSVWTKLKWNTLNNQWMYEQMKKTLYNKQGLDSIRIKIDWDTIANHWVNNYKNEILYDENLNFSDYSSFLWDKELNTWFNDMHQQYTYNENNQLDTATTFSWAMQENEWIVVGKFVVSYNESGKVVERLSVFFDNQNGIWINNWKYEIVYENIFIKSIRYEWDTTANYWQPIHKDIRSFTADSTLHSLQYENWDSLSQQWIPSSRFVSNFDTRHNLIEELFQSWENTSQSWNTMNQSIYFWSAFNPLGINEFEQSSLKIYPNPASLILNVELPQNYNIENTELELLSVNGLTLLRSKLFSFSTQLDISKLNSGLYFVIIRNSKTLITRKVIIQ